MSEEKFFHKENWGAGPWDGEPDRIEFTASGYPCRMRRNAFGAWCGYVGLPPGHPWHGLPLRARVKVPDRNAVEVRTGTIQLFIEALRDEKDDTVALDVLVRCHGGLTFADAWDEKWPDGAPADTWWLGFDCGHAGDLQPGLKALMDSRGAPTLLVELAELAKIDPGSLLHETYRTVVFVRAEVEALAAQAAAVTMPR